MREEGTKADGFNVSIAGDKNIAYRQRLTGHRAAIAGRGAKVLRSSGAGSNHRSIAGPGRSPTNGCPLINSWMNSTGA